MKTVRLEEGTLADSVRDAQEERIVGTSNGKLVALIVRIDGLDEEQIELGSSAKFWELILKRRAERTVSRAALEEQLDSTA
jgi:hypothetical protein